MGLSPHLLWIVPCVIFQGIGGSAVEMRVGGSETEMKQRREPIAEVIADTIRLLLRMTRPFNEPVLDAIYDRLLGEPKELPPIDNKLQLMSATKLAEKIRKKEVSCVEIMQATIDRIKAVQPILNAYVDERFKDALNDAAEADIFLANTTKSEEEIARDTPLLCVPFSCKEGLGVKDMAQTAGLVRSADRKAPQDSDAVALYKKAGAIAVTVTNDPELLLWWESANHVFGMTKNPYDNRRTVGGSTGGDACIITSGSVSIGLGNDLAGSIRIPAAFNGIYGHKPSRGVVSNFGDYPYSYLKPDPSVHTDDFSSTGPLCRYAEDLHMLLKVLTPNNTDLQLDKKVDFKTVKVYYMEEFPGYLQAAVPEVKQAIRKAVNHFEKQYGIQAIKLTIPELYFSLDMWEYKLLQYGNPPITTLLAPGENLNLYTELIKVILGNSTHTLPSIYQAMTEKRDKDKFYYECLELYQVLERRINETLENKDAILLVPTHPETPPYYLLTIPNYPNIGYTAIFNILGLPSTHIPAGLNRRGLPYGFQAISGKKQDYMTLATAVEMDKVFKGWQSPCPITA